jgi:GT2 family glycosyltransferase
MDLTIIIPSFNTKKLLQECLNSIYSSLKEAYLNFEVIVVDNASTDESGKMVSKYFPKVKLIRNKENLGYARANNLAVEKAKGKYILFLNSDIKVLGNAIEKLYNFLSKNIEAEIAGGKLLNSDKSPQPSCGPFYSLPVSFAVLFLRGDKWGLTRYSPSKVKKVDWVSGACLLMRKEVFKKIGRFDESIFMYMDEVEFLYRAGQLGYSTYFYPGAEFIHYGAASSKGKQQPVINIFGGLIYFYRKHKMGYQLFILQLMLLLKSIIGIAAGVILRNKNISEIYKKAIIKILINK